MFGNYRIADAIAYLFTDIDNQCRSELRAGVIVSEPVYVATFAARIRDLLRASSWGCYAQVIEPTLERKLGVDGIILFRHGNQIKVGLFEAKWPRITQANYGWDQLVDGVSHFSSQILRQRTFSKSAAIWEMFLNEGPDGEASPPFKYHGNSCSLHNNAFDHVRSAGLIHSRWTTRDLQAHLMTSCVSIYSVIYDLLSCSAGALLEIDKDGRRVRLPSSSGDEELLNIPIPENLETADNDQRFTGFMLENGLRSYLFVDLESRKI